MSEAALTFAFDGPAIKNGEIDVQDLAPALLSIGNLIQTANEELNGNKAQITVKVRATSEGSFEIDLTLVQSLMESAKAFFHFAREYKDEISTAKDLIDLLFSPVSIGSGLAVIGGGFFQLLKWLKGRKPDKIEPKDGDVHIHIGDTYFMTSPKVLQLAKSVQVREQAKKAVSILSKKGIDKIKVKSSINEELEVSKSEINYFEYDQDEEKITDEIREMKLQIISLSFKEDNKWRVTDGGEPFRAGIEDTAFLNKINNNEIAFAKNDYLVCRVREKQFQTSRGLKKEISIIEVLKHIPTARQLRLF